MKQKKVICSEYSAEIETLWTICPIIGWSFLETTESLDEDDE